MIQMWHFSRTLTAVHDAILEDLVFPSEIVGKRIRVKLDGSRLIKVHLDKAQQNNVEHKVNKFTLLRRMGWHSDLAHSKQKAALGLVAVEMSLFGTKIRCYGFGKTVFN